MTWFERSAGYLSLKSEIELLNMWVHVLNNLVAEGASKEEDFWENMRR